MEEDEAYGIASDEGYASPAEVLTPQQSLGGVGSFGSAGGGGSKASVEAKYLDEVKRNRQLNVKYEAERSKVSKLQQKIVSMEREAQQLSAQEAAVTLPSLRGKGPQTGAVQDEERAAYEQALAEHKDRLDKATKASASARRQLEDAKREISRMRKVLAQEVGEENLEKCLLADGGEGTQAPTPIAAGWKGRAQQITLLKAKVKDLTRTLKNASESGTFAQEESSAPLDDMASIATRGSMVTTATSRRDFDEVNRQAIEHKQSLRRQDTRDLSQLMVKKDEELQKERTKSESLAARLSVLERDNQHLRMCLQRIIEKTENDDKLITAYKEEIDQLKEANHDANVLAQSNGKHSAPAPAVAQPAPMRLSMTSKQFQEFREVVNELKALIREPMPPMASTHQHVVHAYEVIEHQRKGILALEALLTAAELPVPQTMSSDGTSPTSAQTSVLREQNAALRDRLRTLGEVMDREISLYKSLSNTGGGGGGGNGARDAAHTRSDSAPPGNHTTSASSDANAVDHAEHAKLKEQYAQLRKAYNAAVSSGAIK